MISVDTDILVRILTCDDELQMCKARALFEHNDIFIADTVILETEWVLRYAYEFSGPDINDALGRLLGLPQVHVTHPRQIADALLWHKHGLDFADSLHLSASKGQGSFFTFDRQFVKQAKWLGLKPKVQTP